MNVIKAKEDFVFIWIWENRKNKKNKCSCFVYIDVYFQALCKFLLLSSVKFACYMKEDSLTMKCLCNNYE